MMAFTFPEITKQSIEEVYSRFLFAKQKLDQVKKEITSCEETIAKITSIYEVIIKIFGHYRSTFSLRMCHQIAIADYSKRLNEQVRCFLSIVKQAADYPVDVSEQSPQA